MNFNIIFVASELKHEKLNPINNQTFLIMKIKFYPLLRVTSTVFLVLLGLWSFSQTQTITLQNANYRQGFNLLDSKSNKVEIHYATNEFLLEDFVANGERMKSVLLPGVFLPNDEGAPNLAGESRYIAIPQGATPVLNIKSMQVQKFENVEVGLLPVCLLNLK